MQKKIDNKEMNTIIEDITNLIVDKKIVKHGTIITFNNGKIIEESIWDLIDNNNLTQIHDKLKEISQKDKSILNLKKIKIYLEKAYIPLFTNLQKAGNNKRKRLERGIELLTEEIRKNERRSDDILDYNRRMRNFINSIDDKDKSDFYIKAEILREEQEIEINLFKLRISHEECEMLKYRRKIKEESLKIHNEMDLKYLNKINKANNVLIIIEDFLK